MRSVAQTTGAIKRAHSDELQPSRAGEGLAVRKRTTYEIATLLQHAQKAKIVGTGVAIQFCAGDMPFFDTQRVERIETVRRDAKGISGVEQCFPGLRSLPCRHRHLVRQLTRERDAEQSPGDSGNPRFA